MNPKLRRVFALAALISALSLLPAQAAGFAAAREPRRVSLSESFERWGASAWSFLAGLFAKAGARADPSGLAANSDDGGH